MSKHEADPSQPPQITGKRWILLRSLIAGAVFLAGACLLFSTEITPDELERRIEQYYPEVFESRPYQSWSEAIIDTRIREQNFQMHSEFETQAYIFDAWVFRRFPLTVGLWVIYLLIERIRALRKARPVPVKRSPAHGQTYDANELMNPIGSI